MTTDTGKCGYQTETNFDKRMISISAAFKCFFAVGLIDTMKDMIL